MSAFEREMGWIFWALEVMLSSVLYIPRNSKQCLSYLFLKNICRQLMATLSTAVGMFISHVSEQIRESRNGLVKKKIMPETLWLLESAGNCSVSNFSSPSYLLCKALLGWDQLMHLTHPCNCFLTRVRILLLRSPLHRWGVKQGEMRLKGRSEVRKPRRCQGEVQLWNSVWSFSLWMFWSQRRAPVLNSGFNDFIQLGNCVM